MAPGVVTSALHTEESNGKKGAAPSTRISDASAPTPLSEPSPSEIVAAPSPPPSLSDQLAVRVERARDALADTPLFGSLSAASSAAAKRMATLWEFSKTAGWIVGTSALVLVVPLLYEMDKEIVSNTADANLINSAAQGAPAAAAPAPAAAAPAPAAPAAGSAPAS